LLTIRYTVLQPVTAALLTSLLIGTGLYPSCSTIGANNSDQAGTAVPCLEPPGWGTILGMFGVFSGLALVIFTEPRKASDTAFKYEQVEKDKDTSLPRSEHEMT
jgi:hypothetical protein